MLEILVLIAGALLVGLAKGGFGPMGALIVPLLGTTMPISQAIGLALPLLLFGDWFALRAYWKTWDNRLIRLTIPAALVGIVLGLILLNSLSEQTLRRVLGVFTLGVAIYKLASDSLQNVNYSPEDWHGVLAGSVSGFASALANLGGPPMTAYLLLQKLQPVVFVGTATLFFAIANGLKLPAYLLSGVIDIDELVSILWTLPLIPIGVWLGRKLINHIPPRLFDALMMVGLLSAALLLLWD